MADAQNKLKINVSPDKMEARYSDFAIIAKNALGFNFDFAQRMPGGKQVNVVARIAMSPQHAKLFAQILQRNIEQYENEFGEIKVPQGVKPAAKEGGVIHFVK
jgi:hypothetical protein